MSSSSTRSTASPVPSRRSSTRQWRTTNSTSCSARDRQPARSAWNCPASPLSEQPPAPASSPDPCVTASASPPASTTTRPATWRPSSPAPPASSTSTSTPTAPARSHAAPGDPRIGNRLLRQVRDFAQVERGGATVDGTVARDGLSFFAVDDLGLDRPSRAILSALCERFDGGPVGPPRPSPSASASPTTPS